MKKTFKKVPQVVEIRKPKTKAERISDAMESITHRIEFEKRISSESVANFAARLLENPLNAFQWSEDAVKGAARRQVTMLVEYIVNHMREKQSKEVYEAPTDEAVIEAIHSRLKEDVMRKAKWPQSSTSPMSNHASLMEMAQLAEWLDYVERALEHIAKAE